MPPGLEYPIPGSLKTETACQCLYQFRPTIISLLIVPLQNQFRITLSYFFKKDYVNIDINIAKITFIC